MTIQEAIALIDNDHLKNPYDSRNPDLSSPTLWADLGCGAGLFTHALSHFLPADSTIYAIDRQTVLKKQTTPRGVDIIPLERDFIKDPLNFPQPCTPASGNRPSPLLNGILMANSLHYVKDKPAFLQNIKASLALAPTFLIVEYDIDQPVLTWVPYPVNFTSLQRLFHNAGYQHIQKINERPSLFGRGNLYAALVH